MLQISMDGPNVNWRLLEELTKNRNEKDDDLPMLLNLGSCSLHVIHGAFRYGALQTEWNLDGILRALWFTFHDSPARREDFTAITGSSLFPLKFWATCWLDFVYLGFYVAFNTVQVISRRVVGRAEETSTLSSLGLCTVNCRPTASNYQLSHLRP